MLFFQLLLIVAIGFVSSIAVVAAGADSIGESSVLPVAVIATLTLLALAVRLTYGFKRRVARMQRTLERVRDGNVAVRCERDTDEMGGLGERINQVLQQLTDLSVNVIDTDRELQFTQHELQLKEEIAEKGRLLEATNLQLEERIREMSLLFSTSRALSVSLELPELLRSLCSVGEQSLRIDRFAVLVFDERSKSLQVKASFGFADQSTEIHDMSLYSGEGVSGTVFENRRMILISDLQNDHRFLHFRGKVPLQGSLLALPLVAGEVCVGVALFQRDKVNSFQFDEVGLYHIIANQIASAVENALLYQQTRELATHDELTGLFNRRVLETRLEMEWERFRRFNITLAFIMVDVDFFKRFNDEFGHLLGDRVLRQVAQLVPDQVRKVDTVARYGGEEFAVLLPRTTKVEAAVVAEKLREAVAAVAIRPDNRDEDIGITISLGVASTEDAPRSAKQLLDMADHALLVSKSSGRNRVTTYGEHQLIT